MKSQMEDAEAAKNKKDIKYYLDTETLYQIKKIPEGAISSCFYSVFNLLELIAGITYETFKKRQAILRNVINSSASCDYSFPEQILSQSFEHFSGLEFTEERADDLFRIIDDIINADSFATFQLNTMLAKRKFDFPHFCEVDLFMTSNFYESSVKGLEILRQEFKNTSRKATVNLGGKTFDISTRRKLISLLDEPFVDSSFTILALATEAQRMFIGKIGRRLEKRIYESYNGMLENFLTAFSAYSRNMIMDDRIPQKNDFQDLTHIYYLRNSKTIKMVSNDKLFNKVIPAQTLSLNSFIQLK